MCCVSLTILQVIGYRAVLLIRCCLTENAGRVIILYRYCKLVTRHHERRRHGQEAALAPPLPLLQICVKCFCVLVVTVKRSSADELFMHYFHNLSSASGGEAPRVPRPLPWLHRQARRQENPFGGTQNR